MQPLLGIVSALAAVLLGLAGTMLVEKLAPHVGLVQPPNERSSHTRPTPRGGGISIALTVVGAILLIAATGAGQLWLVAFLTLAIGILGFCDDLLDLSPALRFPVQVIVVSLAVWWAGALPPIDLPFGLQLNGSFLAVVAVLAGLWWLNLFNFMDGIDGIAATHAILVLVGMATIWALKTGLPDQDPAFWLAILTSAATFGFLIRNWPPAKIFMGDAGSNSLAFAIFVVALMTVAAGQLSYQAWLILPSAFIADATLTLLVRSAKGERPWRAHRSHAYQHISRIWGHRQTTLVYCAGTAFWCFPMAIAAEIYPAQAWAILGLTYIPLVGFGIWKGAGQSERAVDQ